MRPIDMKGVPLRSLAEMLQRRVSQTPGELAYQIRDGDGWRDLNWSQFGDSVSQIARGLLALGVLPGDRCAILVGTRLEWIAIDFGILTAGCETTTIYRSSTPDDCRYILHDSGARVCFVENQEQLQKILAVREKLPNLTAVILVDGESGAEKVYGLAELKTMAVPNAKLEETIAAIRPTDLACLIYTSGTTGEPKGVMLTHGSFLAMTQAVEDRSKNYQDEKQLLFLPLAHVFGKVCELTSVYVGVPTAIDGDLERLVDTMAEVRPTIMAAVPRVFEKCFNIVVRRARQAGSRKFRVFQWALRIGRRVSVFQQNRK